MGKAALLIVLGFIVIFGMVRINIDKTSESASSNAAKYAETVLARNIANSATELGISVFAETGNDSSYSSSDFMGGSYTAFFTDLGDTTRITVTATFEGESHTTIVNLRTKSTMFPGSNSSGSFTSPNLDYFFSDSILVSGNDTNIDGTPGPAASLPGLAVASLADSVTLEAEIAGNPQWLEGSIEILVDTMPPAYDLSELFAYYESNGDTVISGGQFTNVNWGTQADPLIVYIDGDCFFKGTSVGYGILAVYGGLRMSDFATWYGLVLVYDSTTTKDTRMDSSSKIIGGIIMDAPTPNLRINNFSQLRYSSEALNMAQTDLEGQGGLGASKIIIEKIWYE